MHSLLASFPSLPPFPGPPVAYLDHFHTQPLTLKSSSQGLLLGKLRQGVRGEEWAFREQGCVPSRGTAVPGKGLRWGFGLQSEAGAHPSSPRMMMMMEINIGTSYVLNIGTSYVLKEPPPSGTAHTNIYGTWQISFHPPYNQLTLELLLSLV